MNLWRTFDAKWSWRVCGSCLCSSPTRVLGSVVWSRHVNNQLTKTISVQLSVPGHLATFFEPFDLWFLRVAVQSTLERKPTAPHSIGALFRHRHCKHWRWSQSRQGGHVPPLFENNFCMILPSNTRLYMCELLFWLCVWSESSVCI